MNTAKMLIGYTIESGPSREDLLDAFGGIGSDCAKTPISFEIIKDCPSHDGRVSCREVQTKNTKITGLKYDGDSKYAFVIEGAIEVYFGAKPNNSSDLCLKPVNCKFIACYDTTTGKGRTNILVPNQSIR